MLLPIHHSRLFRHFSKPLFVNFFKTPSFFFTNPSFSVAAALKFDGDGVKIETFSHPSDDTICGLMSSLSFFGPRRFLGDNKFKDVILSLNSAQVGRIVDLLMIQNPGCAVEFFYLLKNKYGFRVSKRCVFGVFHVLAGTRRLRELRKLMNELVRDEGECVVMIILCKLCSCLSFRKCGCYYFSCKVKCGLFRFGWNAI